VGKDAIKIELLTQFASKERGEIVHVNASRKEVGLTSFEFSSTGSREKESESSGVLVQKHLHYVQQSGNTLYLIDEYCTYVRGGTAKLMLQPLRVCGIVPECGGAGQVQGQIRFERGEQGGFSDLTGSQDQDATLALPHQLPAKDAFEHVGKIAAYLPAVKNSSVLPEVTGGAWSSIVRITNVLENDGDGR
jgi:hypothetical protein